MKFFLPKNTNTKAAAAPNRVTRFMVVLSAEISAVLIFTCFVFACSKEKNAAMPATNNGDTSTAPIVNLDRYLALGDSYTIGQSVDSAARYPAQAAALLASQSNIHFSGIQYIATTGWTTANLKDAIEKTSLQPPYSAVTLLIGVNDQHQGVPLDTYKKNFTELLDTAISLAGNIKKHVFVLSIPDYSVTPYGGNNATIAKEIDAFNAANKSITEQQGIAYIDVTAISRRAAGDASMLSPDNLHPSGKQYAQWAAMLVQLMPGSLKN